MVRRIKRGARNLREVLVCIPEAMRVEAEFRYQSQPEISFVVFVLAFLIPSADLRILSQQIAVSCVANLARGDDQLKEDIRGLIPDKRCADTEEGITWFNGERPVKRLLHFISAEKPAFAPDIVPSHLSKVFLVKPKLSNRRILAQEGCFFAFGLTDNIPPKGMPGIKIQRIRIPAEDKVMILAQLKRVAINERTMFPEIERAAKYLTEDVSATAILSRT